MKTGCLSPLSSIKIIMLSIKSNFDTIALRMYWYPAESIDGCQHPLANFHFPMVGKGHFVMVKLKSVAYSQLPNKRGPQINM